MIKILFLDFSIQIYHCIRKLSSFYSAPFLFNIYILLGSVSIVILLCFVSIAMLQNLYTLHCCGISLTWLPELVSLRFCSLDVF